MLIELKRNLGGRYVMDLEHDYNNIQQSSSSRDRSSRKRSIISKSTTSNGGDGDGGGDGGDAKNEEAPEPADEETTSKRVKQPKADQPIPGIQLIHRFATFKCDSSSNLFDCVDQTTSLFSQAPLVVTHKQPHTHTHTHTHVVLHTQPYGIPIQTCS